MSFVPIDNRSSIQGINRTQQLAAGLKKLLFQGPRVPTLVRWCFLLTVFSLPYEYADLGIMRGADVVKITSVLLVLLYVFYYGVSPQRTFAFPGLALGCFAAYVAVFAAAAFADLTPGGLLVAFTLAQLLLFLWIAADLLKSPSLAQQALLAYALATFLLAGMALSSIPGFTEIKDGRVAVLGDNPNTQAQHMVLGILIIVNMMITGAIRQPTRRLLATVMVMVLLVGMAQTGSRAAMVAFGLASVIFLFPYYHSKRIFIPALLGIATVTGGIYMLANNPEFSERWRLASEGDSAGRDEIYGTALDMIAEKPIVGWGPVTAFYELGNRLGMTTGRDVHNMFLDLFLGLGTVGAIPFIGGIVLCVRSAWRVRKGALALLPLALITANVSASMFHTNVTWKVQWLVFAVTLGASIARVAVLPKPALARAPRRGELIGLSRE